MSNYRYKKYTAILAELEKNGFSQLSVNKCFNVVTDRYESWICSGQIVLIEIFTDGYAAIYVDSKNLPKIKKANKTKNGNTNN